MPTIVSMMSWVAAARAPKTTEIFPMPLSGCDRAQSCRQLRAFRMVHSALPDCSNSRAGLAKAKDCGVPASGFLVTA